ncbi:MAG: hypothetical protein Kow002_07510 [Anaerolineales bacterium]
MTIPTGNAGSYRVAQLDDYTHLTRGHFPAHPPRTLSLRARASTSSLPGTWGFGLWNDPFGFSLGFGSNPFRIPALPNAIWFFHASEENYLSFSNKPGNGFLAQAFRSPALPLFSVARIGLTLPVSQKKARAYMSKIVQEDGVRLDVDVTQWHAYRLEWSPKRSVFWVDDVLVLETSVSPRPPLGLVIWIDNQFAAWRPDGRLGFGVLANDECWLEVKELVIRNE